MRRDIQYPSPREYRPELRLVDLCYDLRIAYGDDVRRVAATVGITDPTEVGNLFACANTPDSLATFDRFAGLGLPGYTPDLRAALGRLTDQDAEIMAHVKGWGVWQ